MDFDWQSGIGELRKKFSEQKKFLDKGLADINRDRQAALRRLMTERQKDDIRIKAARTKASREESAKVAKALADQRSAFGPSGPVIVSGPDVAGLPRHPKNSGDVGNDT